MQALEIGSKNISIFLSTKPRTPIIYLNTFSDEGRKVYEAAQATGCPPFTLVAISDLDWNHDMVPWDSPPAFKNAEPCTGGADDYLRLLTRGDHPHGREGTCWSSVLAGDRRILPGRTVCPVRHLPDGPIFPGGQHVRLSLVPRHEGVHLLPRAQAPAGLRLLLPWRQGEQDSEPRPAECPTEHGGDPVLLSGQGDQHNISVESWQPLRPCCGAHRCRYCLAAEPIGLVKQAAPRYNGRQKGGIVYGGHSMPALRKSRKNPGQPVGVRLLRRFRKHLLAPSLGKGQTDGDGYAHRSGHRHGDGFL